MEGIVVKTTGLWYEVKVGGERYVARLRGKFRLDDKKLTNPIAAGDRVTLQPNLQVDNEWVITDILPRRNYVIRSSPRKKGHEHLIASNIDQGALVVTLRRPRTSQGFIDRFLITLESFRIPGILLFNKSDLYKNKDMALYEELKEIYEALGYRVLLNQFDDTLEPEVAQLFEHKTTLLCGHSGSGKSTLVNQLVPDAAQEVSEISNFANKGVHTTTFAEMFYQSERTAVIDTPGIKELGLSEIAPEELSHYFPEMRSFIGQCKYHNCIHTEEPGCMIKAQVGESIALSRYESYLSILLGGDNRR